MNYYVLSILLTWLESGCSASLSDEVSERTLRAGLCSLITEKGSDNGEGAYVLYDVYANSVLSIFHFDACI